MSVTQTPDSGPVSKVERAKAFAMLFYKTWSARKPSRQAAALAYYGVFSFAPVLYVIIKVAGFFLQEWIAPLLNQLYLGIQASLGTEMADLIRDLLLQAAERTSEGSTVGTLIGIAALLYAASGLFTQIKYSLNAIWEVAPDDQGGMVRYALNRLLAFALVIGLGLLLVAAIVAAIVVSVLRSRLPWQPYLPVANILLLYLLTTLTFGVIYKLLPDTNIAWRDLWIGAPVTAALVLLGGWAVLFYLGNFNVGSALQAAGSLAVMLIGFYYVAQIFLIGAIFTRVYAEQFGSKAGRERTELTL